VDEFYEAYWSANGRALSDDDSTSIERKRLLVRALSGLAVTPGSDGVNGKVLDAGCGAGEFSSVILGLGFAVVGVDIAAAAVERARRQCGGGTFHIASLEERLPFPAGEFVAIWSTEVLEHIFDVHACLSEFNRVLCNGGLLVLTTPYHGLCKNLAITVAGFERHFNPRLSHIRFFTRQSLTECLTHAGFVPELWRGVGRMWPLYKSSFVIARKVSTPRPAPAIIG
jgi:SAM-dependent methyltransferase